MININKALDKRLDSMSGGYPIAWENTPYSPTLETVYLRPTLLPANSAGFNVKGTTDSHQGIYQIDIYASKDKGKSEIYSAVSVISAHFARGLQLTESSEQVVIGPLSISPMRIDEAWAVVSVSVRYRSWS